MIFSCISLIASLAGPAMAPVDIVAACFAVRDAVMEVDPLPLDADFDDAHEKTSLLVAAWGYRESRLTDAVGQACGPMQVDRVVLASIGGHCREGLTAGFRYGIEVMRRAISHCNGNVRAGLGAYSTNWMCGGAPGLVAYRCNLSGAC